MNILLLGLGNDLLRDDGVGLLAARSLRNILSEDVTVQESREGGYALLDLLTGYDAVVLLDAIQTGRVPRGTLRFDVPHHRFVIGVSYHFKNLYGN